MKNNRTITPEEVVQAYTETKMVPMAGTLWTVNKKGQECACGLGVLLRKNHCGYPEQMGLTSHYVRGFTFGFDDIPILEMHQFELDEELKAGHRDGQEARRSVELNLTNGPLTHVKDLNK